jgi:hypothetical protein
MEKMADVTVREKMQPPEGFNVVMANAVQQCQ